jgi:PhzF family phenazine biosynthesis protein
MTSLPFFQVDAFAERPLTGNPAAVMPLERWLDEELMQAIAAENNLSETAFTVPSERDEADFDLRWFTPAVEVDLCGHASIAAGHVLMTGQPVRFSTRSGILTVSRRDDRLELDLPAAPLEETREPDLCSALNLPDTSVWLATACNDAAIIEVADEAAVRAVAPDFKSLAGIHRMAIVTARGDTETIASWRPTGPSGSAAPNSPRFRRASAPACSIAAWSLPPRKRGATASSSADSAGR